MVFRRTSAGPSDELRLGVRRSGKRCHLHGHPATRCVSAPACALGWPDSQARRLREFIETALTAVPSYWYIKRPHMESQRRGARLFELYNDERAPRPPSVPCDGRLHEDLRWEGHYEIPGEEGSGQLGVHVGSDVGVCTRPNQTTQPVPETGLEPPRPERGGSCPVSMTNGLDEARS